MVNLILSGCVNEHDPIPGEEIFSIAVSEYGPDDPDDDMRSLLSHFELSAFDPNCAVTFKTICHRQQKLMEHYEKLIDIVFPGHGDLVPEAGGDIANIDLERNGSNGGRGRGGRGRGGRGRGGRGRGGRGRGMGRGIAEAEEVATNDDAGIIDRDDENLTERIQLHVHSTINKDNMVELFRLYVSFMGTLRTYKNFNAEEVDSVQLEIDKFCRLYRFMFGARLTNYIHDLQAGHIRFF